MNRLADARTRLHAALVPILPDGRVHKFAPSSVVSPCIYLDAAAGSVVTQGSTTMLRAVFPVVAIADGDTNPQGLTLDDLTAQIWDRARLAGISNAVSWSPGNVDVGGVNQRSVTVVVEMFVTARTLCDPPISE